MRIIQVSSYYPPRLGGMQNVVRELCERLASAGHDVTVYTSAIGTGQGRLKSSRNLRIRYCWGFEFAHTPILPGLFFVLLGLPSDALVHIHCRPFAAEVAALVARIRRVPYIVEIHSDFQPLGFFSFLIPIYKRTGWRWVMRHAQAVVLLSHYQEVALSQAHGLLRTVVIPNGVDQKFYMKKRVRSNNNRPRLLFVGRLNNQKNLPFLIETLSLMKHEAVLDIVGEGEMRAELEALIAANNLTSRVILSGMKVGEALLDRYRDADVYVMASHFEGLSLAMLEGMAASLPVVALDAPGVTEHIENVGVVVRKREPAALAQALDGLLSDTELLSTMAENSHAFAASLSWPSVVARFEELYEAVLAECQQALH